MYKYPPIPPMPTEPYKVEIGNDGQRISYYHRKPGKKRTSQRRYFGVDVGGYSSGYTAELVNENIAAYGFLKDWDFLNGGPTETPHYRLERASPEKGIRDFEIRGDVWLLSEHGKQVFEEIDKGAFRFIRCTTEYRHSIPGPTIWIARVERELDALDRENSDLRISQLPCSEWLPAGRWDYLPLGDLNFLDDVVGDAHCFKQKNWMWGDGCYVDEYFKEQCKLHKVTGIKI
jgi:hypothetical protein